MERDKITEHMEEIIIWGQESESSSADLSFEVDFYSDIDYD